MADVDYRQAPACDGLADRVELIWHLRHPGDENVQPIAPDGACEIILHRTTPPLEWQGGEWKRQGDAFLYGPLDRVLHLCQSGPMDVIGIRLHPWALGALGGHPSVWRNRAVPLTEILGRERAKALHDHACGARDVENFQTQAMTLIDDVLPKGPALNAARVLVEALREGQAGSVSDLARQAGVTERTISRRFERACGLPARTLVRIFRFHRARDAVKQGLSLSEAAQLAGYADQAHMTRDFRQFAGITPVPARQPAAFDAFYASAPMSEM